MWIGAIWMIVGTVIACLTFGPHWGFGQFIIARVISGVGTGMLTATIPSWVAECSKAHNRGFLICSEASTVAVGTVIAYWTNYGCVSASTDSVLQRSEAYPHICTSPKSTVRSRGDSPLPFRPSSPSSSSGERSPCPNLPDGCCLMAAWTRD